MSQFEFLNSFFGSTVDVKILFPDMISDEQAETMQSTQLNPEFETAGYNFENLPNIIKIEPPSTLEALENISVLPGDLFELLAEPNALPETAPATSHTAESSTLEVPTLVGNFMVTPNTQTLLWIPLDPSDPSKAVARVDLAEPASSTPLPKQQKGAAKYKIHNNTGFHCAECDRFFNRRSGLTQHNNARHSVSGPLEHRCGRCGKRFETDAQLKAHEKRHRDEEKEFGCPDCSKKFNYQHDLDRHYFVNHGGTAHSCKLCDKKFGRSDHLKAHLISHGNKTVKPPKKTLKTECSQ